MENAIFIHALCHVDWTLESEPSTAHLWPSFIMGHSAWSGLKMGADGYDGQLIQA